MGRARVVRRFSVIVGSLVMACGGGGGSGEPTPAVGGDADVLAGADGAVVPEAEVVGGDADGDAPTAEDSGRFVPGCTTDEQCGAGQVCDCTGECVPLVGQVCETSKNCGSGLWCNTCSGQCEARETLCGPCFKQGQCDLGAGCVPLQSGGTYCGLSCLTDAGCPKGYWCVAVAPFATKQCLPKSGSCVDLDICEDDGDCPGTEVCNATSGECAPGCEDDASCPQPMLCVLGRCKQPCATVDDCEAGEECVDGRCKIPGACEKAGDCPEPETYCDKAEGMCKPGCLTDEDCSDAAMICEAKSCVKKGCEHNYTCAFAEECLKDSGECAPTPDPHCETCSGGQSMADAAACGAGDHLCLKIQDEEGNDKGEFCFLACKEDPVDQCPQGYGCQHLEAPDAGIDGWYCIRECWVEPQ